MRPRAVVILVGLLAGVAALAYLLSDRWVERGLERAGEAVVGARVEVDGLDVQPTSLAVSLRRLQVANPNDTWKNLFETGRLAFDLGVAALARKKVHIQEVTIADVRIGTKRETDGRLPRPPDPDAPGWFERARQSLERRLADAPVLNLGLLNQKVDVDAVLASFDMQTPARLDSLKQELTATQQRWQARLRELDPRAELAGIERELDELKARDLEKVDQLVLAVDQAKRLYDRLKALERQVTEQKRALTADVGEMQNKLARTDDWLSDDFSRLSRKVNLSEFTPQNVGAMLFGEKVVGTITNLLYYVALARKYMPVAQQVLAPAKVERPPRFRGQDVRFPVARGWPDFLIEQISLSAATNQEDRAEVTRLSGTIAGITSDPGIYGQPLTLALRAALPESKAFEINGVFDHTGAVPKDQLELRGQGLRLGRIDLPARPYLPAAIRTERGEAVLQMEFAGEELDMALRVNARPVAFEFADSLKRDDPLAELVSEVFDSVDYLQLEVGVRGNVDRLNLQIASNLDEVLARRVNRVVGESVRLARAEIDKRMRARVAPARAEAQTLLTGLQRDLLGEINTLERGISKHLQFVSELRTELEKRVASSKKKGLEDLSKKLKGLIDN